MAAPVIGLTGGIGSGKSTVAAMLAERGALVIDADRVGHEVYEPGTEGHRRVVEEFGSDVLRPDGAIDRVKLGALVFADPEKRRRLNAIIHPLIGAEVQRRIAESRARDPERPIVLEVILLVEVGWSKVVDRVWVVSVARETAMERLTRTRGLSRDEIERRLAAQLPDAERRKHAHLVIENDGTPEQLRAQVEAAWRTLVG